LGPVTGALTPRAAGGLLGGLLGGPTTPRGGGLQPLGAFMGGGLSTPRGGMALPPLMEASVLYQASLSPTTETLSSRDDTTSESPLTSTSSAEDGRIGSAVLRSGAMLLTRFPSYDCGEDDGEDSFDDSPLCLDEDSDEMEDEARCFGASCHEQRMMDSVVSESGVWGDMDDELDAMATSLAQAKQRSEGMRAQCKALQAMGERQDAMLGRPAAVPRLNFGVFDQAIPKASAPSAVPKLNLGGADLAKKEPATEKPATLGPHRNYALQLSSRLPQLDPTSLSTPDLPSSFGSRSGSLTARSYASVQPRMSKHMHSSMAKPKDDLDSLLADLDF